jgi:hypothetical protein
MSDGNVDILRQKDRFRALFTFCSWAVLTRIEKSRLCANAVVNYKRNNFRLSSNWGKFNKYVLKSFKMN